MDICIDFDGTCVTHEFPVIGKDIGAIPVLRDLVKQGHRLILFTMRSNCSNNNGCSKEFPTVSNGNFLDHAVRWFADNDIPLFGINSNPEQLSWTTSPKAYGQLYIDDAALGCPITYEYEEYQINGESALNLRPIGRPFVDWKKVHSWLILNGYLKY